MLEQEIRKWLDAFSKDPAFSTEDVAELESHLKENIAQHVASGMDEHEAFTVATESLGTPSELRSEFKKVKPLGVRVFGVFRGVYLVIGLIAISISQVYWYHTKHTPLFLKSHDPFDLTPLDLQVVFFLTISWILPVATILLALSLIKEEKYRYIAMVMATVLIMSFYLNALNIVDYVYGIAGLFRTSFFVLIASLLLYRKYVWKATLIIVAIYLLLLILGPGQNMFFWQQKSLNLAMISLVFYYSDPLLGLILGYALSDRSEPANLQFAV